MKPGIILFLLLSIIAGHPLSAQQGADSAAPGADRHNRIGAGIGVTSMQTRDEAGSPMAYSGVAWPLRVLYEYDGDNDRHWASFGYIKTGINASALRSVTTADAMIDGREVTGHTADYSLRTFRYGYARRIADVFDGRSTIFLGAVWDNYLFIRYYNYGYRETGERDPKVVTWEGVFSLNALVAGEYAFDDAHRLTLSLHAPFLAFVIRPRYAVQDDELIKISFDNFSQLKNGRSRFVTFGDLLQADAHLRYDHALSALFDLQLDYRFTFYRYEQPRRTAAVINAFGAGLLFKF